MPGSASSTTANANRVRSPRRLAGAMAGAASSSRPTCAKRRWRSRRSSASSDLRHRAQDQWPSAGDRLAVRQRETKPLVADLENSMRAERARLSRHADDRPGDRLYADPLAGLHPLPRRRPHLPQQQRRRTRITWNCLGRRAWLFAGSDRGGERAAAIYTLIVTAKLNDIDPQAWLADVLRRIADHRPRVSTNCFPGTGGPGLPHSRHEARPQFRRARGARGDRHRAHRTTRQRSGKSGAK